MEKSGATGWNIRWKKMENLRDPGYYIFSQQLGRAVKVPNYFKQWKNTVESSLFLLLYWKKMHLSKWQSIRKRSRWISYPVTHFCFFKLWDGNGELAMKIHSNSPLVCLPVLQRLKAKKHDVLLFPHSKSSGVRTHQVDAITGDLEGGRQVTAITPSFSLSLLASRVGEARLGFSAAEFQCLQPCEAILVSAWIPRFHGSLLIPHLPCQAAKISDQFSSTVVGVIPAGPTWNSQLQFYMDKIPYILISS